MKHIFAFIAIALCATYLKAQIPLTDTTPEQPMRIELGKSYLFPTDFSIAYFTFTSEKDGLLRMKMSQNLKIFESNEDGDAINPIPIFDNTCIQGIRAGKSYHFQSTTTWGASITMEIFFEEGVPFLPLSLDEIQPANGSTYHTTEKEGCVTFSFNGKVNTSLIEANLVLADGEKIPINNYQASEDYNTLGTIYTLYLAETYNSLLTDEKLKAKDIFYITLNNIVSPSDTENKIDEELKVAYIASAEAARLVSTNAPEKIKSYYMPGNEEGIITLTFSSDITSTAKSATLSYGDREKGSWKEISIPYTIESNLLKWNLQGIHLNEVPEDSEGLKFVSIQQRNLFDMDGRYIESNTPGSLGTINLSFEVELLELNIYPDFLPTIGSNIDEAEEIEIWISAGKYLSFDGAQIICQSNGESKKYIFSKEELRITDDPYSTDDLLIYIPIKDCLFDAGKITVELTNVIAADGSSPLIQGSFKSEGKKAQSIDPAVYGNNIEYILFNIDGTPTKNPSKKGIYLKWDTNRHIKKIIIH